MRPLWKWILGIIAFLIVLLLGGAWYFSRNWKPLLEEKLKTVISESTNGLYRLQYQDLDLNLALGNVTLKDAELVPDSSVYANMERAQTAPDNRYHIKLKTLRIKRFNTMDMLLNRKLHIRKIDFDNPEIHVINQYHAYNDTVASKQQKTLYEGFKDVLSSVTVSNIAMEDIAFTYTKMSAGKSSVTKLDSIKIQVHDLLIDETALKDSSRFFYTKIIEIDVPSFRYEFTDDIYYVMFDKLKINTQEQNVLLTNVVFRPKMNKAAYFKKRGKNITMADLQLDTLRLEHLDFQKLLDNQQVVAKRVQLKQGTMNLFNDKRYPKTPINQIGMAPHQKLMRVKSLIAIDTVFLDGVDVVYGEHSAKFNREGSISFNQARGYISSVTNDSLLLQQDPFMRADLTAKVMNAGQLQIKFGFDMLSKEGAHTYVGRLSAMNATAFNRIIRPLLNVELASGNIKSVSFNMAGTDYKNWGDFRFDYDNLKVNLLNKQEAGEAKSAKKVVSFLVNQLIINNSNPDEKGVYLTGKVNYKRDAHHTFFKTLWQSLLDGIKQTAGISEEREKRLMGTASTAQETIKGTTKAVRKTSTFIKGIFKKDKDGEAEKNEQ